MVLATFTLLIKTQQTNKMATAKKTTTKTAAPVVAATKLTTNPSTKKVESKVEPVVLSNTFVAVSKTTYHYWRGFCKSYLKENSINAKFKKEDTGYNGTISVISSQVVAAKKVMDKWRKDNPGTIDIFEISNN